jgi:hypothetical protein
MAAAATRTSKLSKDCGFGHSFSSTSSFGLAVVMMQRRDIGA